jgi:hypothetical protein
VLQAFECIFAHSLVALHTLLLFITMQLSSTFLPLVTLALSASAAVLGSIAVTNLPANAKADYQLGGAYTPASDVKVSLS